MRYADSARGNFCFALVDSVYKLLIIMAKYAVFRAEFLTKTSIACYNETKERFGENYGENHIKIN